VRYKLINSKKIEMGRINCKKVRIARNKLIIPRKKVRIVRYNLN